MGIGFVGKGLASMNVCQKTSAERQRKEFGACVGRLYAVIRNTLHYIHTHTHTYTHINNFTLTIDFTCLRRGIKGSKKGGSNCMRIWEYAKCWEPNYSVGQHRMVLKKWSNKTDSIKSSLADIRFRRNPTLGFWR